MGNVVMIAHSVGATLYAHLDSVLVWDGKPVQQGEAIGTVGNTLGLTQGGSSCRSTGSHLHFELKGNAVLATSSDDLLQTWGYTPELGVSGAQTASHQPDAYGYHDPVLNLHANVQNIAATTLVVTSTGGGVSIRTGPATNYRSIGATTAIGQQFTGIRERAGASTNCDGGWYQIRPVNGQYFTDTANSSQAGGVTSIPEAWVCKGHGGQVWIAPASTCANGILEAGEQCDQGAANGSAGSCCDANCRFKVAGTVCRSAAGACDVAESCSGNAGTCPGDGFVAVGVTCRAAAGECDVAETCGAAAQCPADARRPDGWPCSLGTCQAGTCQASAATSTATATRTGSATVTRTPTATATRTQNVAPTSTTTPSPTATTAAGSTATASRTLSATPTHTAGSGQPVVTIDGGPSGSPNPVNSGGSVAVSVVASSSHGLPLSYQWSFSCPTMPSGGGFNQPFSPGSNWTAPVNATGTPQTCTLGVMVSDGLGASASRSYQQTVAAPSPEDIDFGVPSLTFGTLALGSSSTLPAHIVNDTGAPNVQATLVITGVEQHDFSLPGYTLGQTFPLNGGVVPLNVRFAPLGCGPRSAVVQLSYAIAGLGAGVRTLPVSGSGPPCPTLTPTPTATPTPTLTPTTFGCLGEGDLDWQRHQDAPAGGRIRASAAVGDHLFTFGNGGFWAQVWRYDTLADTWTRMPDTPGGCGECGVAAIGTRLYLVSDGTNYKGIGTPTQVFDTGTETWSLAAPIPAPRPGAAVVALDGLVYAIGGRSGSALATVSRYDPVADSWADVTSLPAPRAYAAAAALDHRIYVFGGQRLDGGPAVIVDAYDPATNQWTSYGDPIAWIPTRRSHAIAGAIGCRLYVMGGLMPDGRSTAAVEEFDPVRGEWTTRSPLLQSRWHLGGAAIGSRLVAVAGSANNSPSVETPLAHVEQGAFVLLPTATPTATISPSPTLSASPTITHTRTTAPTPSPTATARPVTPTPTRTSPPLALGVPVITSPGAGQTIVVSGVTFAWTAVAAATGYDLRVLSSSGATVFSGSLIGNGATSTLISLPQDGSYTFRARACAGGFADSQCGPFAARAFAISVVTPIGVPSVTAPAAGAQLTASIVLLSWTAVAGSAGLPVYYEVELLDQASGAAELRILVPHPTLSTVARLHSGPYSLRVRACQVGCGPWSAAVVFEAAIGAVPSSAPAITGAVVSGGNSLTVTWTAIARASWYQLFVIQPPPAGPGGGALTVAAREVVGTSIGGLPLPAGAASILVAACNGNGCGPFSAPSPISAGGPNPAMPNIGQPLGGSVVGGPAVFFSWNRVPGDNGANTTYRLYVQDLSRQTAALDVLTTQNFYGAYFRAEGARYDALVVANPGPNQVVGPAVGFNVRGTSAAAPTMTQPTHNSTVAAGNVQLGWSPLPGATLYEYYVAAAGTAHPPTRGVTPGLVVQVPLSAPAGSPTLYSGIVRACPAGAACAPGSDAGWGPWSIDAGPGVTNFTVTP